jgi:hypothetical protein
MRSKLLMLFVAAGIAALIAPDARAVEQTTAATTRQPSALEKLNASVCDVSGTVFRVKMVDKSPWGQEAPSQMNTIETQISISIDERTPHRKDIDATNHPCLSTSKGTLRTYKLCSPTKVRQGDRIWATEGINTGSAKAIGCLFDIRVVAAAPAPPKKI